MLRVVSHLELLRSGGMIVQLLQVVNAEDLKYVMLS